MLVRIIRFAVVALAAGLAVAALYPWAHELITRVDNIGRLASVESLATVASRCESSATELPMRFDPETSLLATWQNVGGCGAGGGGAGAGGGGVKWVGRKVRGGLIDIECLASTTVMEDGTANTFNLRYGTEIGPKWIFAANVPLLYKTHDAVDVFGTATAANIAGFGDVSLEMTRKLGIDNAHTVTASLAFPVGAYDAVREGVVLPQQTQLGAGKLAGSLGYEQTFDKMWGLITTGGTLGYAGGENAIGDYRSPSASAYVYTGYLLGPLVPSAGLTFVAKTERDRERFEPLDGQPLYTANLNLALEWSSDYLAFLVGGVGSFSTDGMESWTLALGASTSLF